MVKRAMTSPSDTILIATETGLLHRLRKEIPHKTILAADEGAVCRYMKQITLPKLRDTLRDMAPEVIVDPAIAARARLSIDRMLAIKL
jgi:quinolinate synthase